MTLDARERDRDDPWVPRVRRANAEHTDDTATRQGREIVRQKRTELRTVYAGLSDHEVNVKFLLSVLDTKAD